MKRLIVIGGSAPSSFSFDRSVYGSVVAADSGYDTARRLSIPIDSVVGDLDSTSYREEIEAMGIRGCSHDKDESDTELAIASGSGEYDLLGGGEGRIDHTLSLFSTFIRCGYPSLWFMRVDTVASLSGHVELSAAEGTELSFMSIEGTVQVRSKGLFWELDGFPLSPSSVSLSNRMRASLVSLDIDGTILMRMRAEDHERIMIGRTL